MDYKAILDAVNEVPPEAWQIIIETLLAAITVSPIVLGLKKWWDVNSAKIMLFITILMSLGAGALTYLHGDPQFAPIFALVQGWLIFATTQPVYRYFIKGLFTRLGAWFSGKVAEAQEYNDSRKEPVVTPPAEFNDLTR